MCRNTSVGFLYVRGRPGTEARMSVCGPLNSTQPYLELEGKDRGMYFKIVAAQSSESSVLGGSVMFCSLSCAFRQTFDSVKLPAAKPP